MSAPVDEHGVMGPRHGIEGPFRREGRSYAALVWLAVWSAVLFGWIAIKGCAGTL